MQRIVSLAHAVPDGLETLAESRLHLLRVHRESTLGDVVAGELRQRWLRCGSLAGFLESVVG